MWFLIPSTLKAQTTDVVKNRSSGRSSTVVVPGYRKPFETEANHQQHCCREAEAGYLAPETFIQFQSKCHFVQLIIFLKVRNVERI